MTGAIRKGEIYRFVAKGRSTEPLQADIREGLISALQARTTAPSEQDRPFRTA